MKAFARLALAASTAMLAGCSPEGNPDALNAADVEVNANLVEAGPVLPVGNAAVPLAASDAPDAQGATDEPRAPPPEAPPPSASSRSAEEAPPPLRRPPPPPPPPPSAPPAPEPDPHAGHDMNSM